MQHQQYNHPSNVAFTISTDPTSFDIKVIHQFLTEESYWAKDAAISETKALLEDDLCFGLFHKNEQIGFASVTSDFLSFAYISDVFISKKYRNQGLATWLLECVLAHPKVKNMRNLMLLTDDAHGLYEKMGFQRIPGSNDQMIKYNKKEN